MFPDGLFPISTALRLEIQQPVPPLLCSPAPSYRPQQVKYLLVCLVYPLNEIRFLGFFPHFVQG